MCANIAQCHARSALMLLDSRAKLRYSTHIIPKSNNKNSEIDKRCLKSQTLQYVILKFGILGTFSCSSFVLYFHKYFLYEQHQVQGREWFQILGTVGPVKKRTGMRLNSDKN